MRLASPGIAATIDDLAVVAIYSRLLDEHGGLPAWLEPDDDDAS